MLSRFHPKEKPLSPGFTEMLLNRDYPALWEQYILPNGVPLLLGAILSVMLGFLISRGMWLVAAAIAVIIPMVLVLNKYPLVAVMIWFLLMPFLPFTTVNSKVFWVVHRGLIFLALIITIVSRMLRLKEYEPVRWSWAEWSMVTYLVLGGVSIIITRPAPLLYLYELYDRMAVPFMAYWLIRFSNPRTRDLERFFPVMLIVLVAEIVIGFWARYAPGSLPYIWAIERMGDRMSGTFDNPGPYAFTLAVCMIFVFYKAMHSRHKIQQVLLLFIFCLGLLCVFLTFTRGCWLAMVLVLAGFLWMYPKPVLTLGLLAIPIILALSVSVLSAEMSVAFKRLNTQDTIDSRLVLAHAGKEMFYAKPLLGWGFGNYDRYDWKFIEPVGNAAPTWWDVEVGTSHNTFLTILAEMGVIGFFFQFFPLLWWFILTIKVAPRLPSDGFWSWRLLTTLWLPIIFFLVIGQAADMRFFWSCIGIWWFVLGLIGGVVSAYLKPEDMQLPGWIKRSVAVR